MQCRAAHVRAVDDDALDRPSLTHIGGGRSSILLPATQATPGLASGKVDEVRRATHTLKSNAATFGAAEELERVHAALPAASAALPERA